MPRVIKSKSFGRVRIADSNPRVPDGMPMELNLQISFEEAKRLHHGIGEALAKLNTYDHSTNAGRQSALNLSLSLQRQRITIDEGKAPLRSILLETQGGTESINGGDNRYRDDLRPSLLTRWLQVDPAARLREIERVKTYVRRWLIRTYEGIEVLDIRLHGSRVRGTHDPDSDLDVAVLVRNGPEDCYPSRRYRGILLDICLLEQNENLTTLRDVSWLRYGLSQ